jgi:hypothetical protein
LIDFFLAANRLAPSFNVVTSNHSLGSFMQNIIQIAMSSCGIGSFLLIGIIEIFLMYLSLIASIECFSQVVDKTANA